MAPIKRHAYQASLKLEAIEHAARNGNRAAARKFHVNESMVRKWRKQEDALRQVKKSKLSFRGNKAKWPQLEDKIEQWVIEQRNAGKRVSTVSIRLKAKELAHELDIDTFQGTVSWCFRFMKRRNLFLRMSTTTVSHKVLNGHQEKLMLFRTNRTTNITDKKTQLKHTTNMDGVPLTFDIPENFTVKRTGTSTVRKNMSSLTGILGHQVTDRKHSSMVIFKRKTLPKVKLPVVISKANPKGRMDEEVMSDTLKEVSVKRPDGHFHKSPSLLNYDSMCAHLTDTVKSNDRETNLECAGNPDRLTEELQPLDIGINRPFKSKVIVEWESTFTKTEKQLQASDRYASMCQWIVDALAKISVPTITERSSSDNSDEANSDSNKTGMLDAEITELFNSDTEDEEFHGFPQGK